MPLPGAEARVDHLSVDLKDPRLFVAALGKTGDVVLRRGSDKIRPGTQLNVKIATPKKGT
jgi:hypothetical protein